MKLENRGQDAVKSYREVFRIPCWLGLVSLVGLASALVADGFWDGLSWLCLGSVVAAGGYYAVFRHSD